MTRGKFRFLGTGGSMGIPMISCNCEVCLSSSQYNKRTRPGGLLTIGHKKILIDASQDYRFQALKYNIDSLDGVIITHAHHDHTAGIDDLRAYCRNDHLLPLLLSAETYDEVKKRFAYIFAPSETSLSLLPKFQVQLLDSSDFKTTFEGIPLSYVSFKQAGMTVNGFRFGDLAFLSDIKEYDEAIFESLKGINSLIVSALRFTPSALHFTIDEAIAFSKRTGARQTWLTHLAHDLDHEKTNAYLPENIRLAYDSLEIPFLI